MRKGLRAFRLVVALAYRASPAYTIGTAITMVLESGTRVLWPLWLKFLTDGALAADVGAVVRAASYYGVTIAALGVLNLARVNWSRILEERTGFLIDQRLIELTTAVPTLEHHERADYQDEMTILRERREMMAGSIGALLQNLQVFILIGGSFGLLATIHPLLLTLPLFGIPSMIATGRRTAINERAQTEAAEHLRRARHVFELATDAAPAKEIRVFGLADTLLAEHDDAWRTWRRIVRRSEVRGAAVNAAGWLVFGLGYAGALTLAAALAVNDPTRVTVGDAVMAFTLAASINQVTSGLAFLVGWLVECLKTVGRLLWLTDFTAERMHRPTGAVAPDVLTDGIRLAGISFAYPGTEVDVLSDIDLDLPAGATIALVGENGAGKTTLVKLLCGMYRPTAGELTVDGVPLRDIDPGEWRARVSAGFQDFAKFELLARETVGVGDLPRIDDRAAIGVAIERGQAADVVPTLPSGLETQLGRRFEGGVELSEGQWQKLALGRAMMRDAPVLLALDEPTASLDAETEHALFERFSGAARRVAAGNGAVTLLVSHRFSTVRMADLIVVLDGGRVRERGSHAELMARGDLYAELFELQARQYR